MAQCRTAELQITKHRNRNFCKLSVALSGGTSSCHTATLKATFDPVTESASPWPTKGPASYFPSIEKKYGRTIAEWQAIILDNPSAKHVELVQLLKSEYAMGHGHANALVAWTLAGNRA